MLILLPTLFILLCGSLVSCQASQEDSDLAAITQNKTSDSSVSDQDHENQEILNSVTYIDIDGVYFPISYVNHGEQLLSGDVGPYSAFAESLLKEAPPASGLNKIDLPDIDTDAAGLGPIASMVHGTSSLIRPLIKHTLLITSPMNQIGLSILKNGFQHPIMMGQLSFKNL